MKRSRQALCCVFVALMCPLFAFAQLSGANALNAAGTVFAEGASARLQGVALRLCDSGGRIILQSTTSSSGQFNFNGLQAGTYLLELEATGFQSVEVRLDLSFSSQTGLAIYLKPSNQQTLPSVSGTIISVHELSIAEEARNLYREGKKALYNENKAQEALVNFQKALAEAPEFYEARYQEGMAYLSLGKIDEAEKSFRKCIAESGEKYGSANIALGTLQMDKGETESGEKQIRRGLELSPSAWMGYYQLGKSEALAGHLEDAEKQAEQARQFAPATPMVYQLLANIHMKQKNYSALLDDIDAYVRLDPNSPAGARAKQMRAQIQKQMQEEAASR